MSSRANLPKETKIFAEFPTRLITHFSTPGGAGKVAEEVIVTMPANYGKNPLNLHPVIFVFPGYPSDFRKFIPNVESVLSRAKLSNAIVVYPNVFPEKLDTECVNGVQGKDFETWISVDVVNWVKKNLLVRPNPAAWATWGLSAGGWCSAMFAAKYPQIFQTGVSLGGFYKLTQTQGQLWRRPGDPDYDLAKYLKQKKATMIYVGATADHDSYQQARQAKAWVGTPTGWIEHIYPGGAHSWRGLFEEGIPQSFSLLATHSSGFRS